MGPVIFPAICRWTLFTHTRSFFFFSYIFSFKMASAHARPMQKRWDDFHVILLVSCGKNKTPNLVMAQQTKYKFPPPPPPKKKKTVSEWMRMRCKRGSMPWKPFHLTRNVSGISNQKFCLNRKGPRSWLDEKLTHLTLKKSKGTELVVHHRVAMKRVKTLRLSRKEEK